MTISAIIVAAGRGQRAGGDLPKQYQLLQGKTVLRRTVEAFLNHPAVDDVCVVIHPDDRDLYDQSVEGLTLMPPVAGGENRQQSVLNGIEAVKDSTFCLIHDAARCFVSTDVVSNIINTLNDGAKGVVPALPVTDTLKSVVGAVITSTPSRDGLYRAQTPQGFPTELILGAHTACIGKTLTDDASAAEECGYKVHIVEGDEDNIKITHGHDFILGARILGTSVDVRTGTGFDVHAFEEGGHVTLCGVKIPHSHTLSGHSDADVAMHALTDALMGTVAAGDIGKHFPPTDPQWKGASSDIFLKKAMELVKDAGGRVTHADITIICEAPKIGPHVDAMRQGLSQIMGIDTSRISVKATTTEKLGFTGRGEGIAAQATATVVMEG